MLSRKKPGSPVRDRSRDLASWKATFRNANLKPLDYFQDLGNDAVERGDDVSQKTKMGSVSILWLVETAKPPWGTPTPQLPFASFLWSPVLQCMVVWHMAQPSPQHTCAWNLPEGKKGRGSCGVSCTVALDNCVSL